MQSAAGRNDRSVALGCRAQKYGTRRYLGRPCAVAKKAPLPNAPGIPARAVGKHRRLPVAAKSPPPAITVRLRHFDYLQAVQRTDNRAPRSLRNMQIPGGGLEICMTE